MTDIRKAAEMALEALKGINPGIHMSPMAEESWNKASDALRQALAQPVDAVPGFTVTEPRQSLSRMKPGDRFVLVRTGEIYHIKKDGSQWNETRQRLARLHKNSQVRLIVTHPKCDDACTNICTEGFTKPPTCNKPVDAVNISQERVDEMAKREREPLVWMNKHGHVASFQNEEYKDPLYTAPPKREWVGLKGDEISECWKTGDVVAAVEAKLKEKNA